jgi:hypothetical protein
VGKRAEAAEARRCLYLPTCPKFYCCYCCCCVSHLDNFGNAAYKPHFSAVVPTPTFPLHYHSTYIAQLLHCSIALPHSGSVAPSPKALSALHRATATAEAVAERPFQANIMASDADSDADPAPTSTVARRTARRRSTKLAALTAGKSKDPGSFVTLEGTEAEIAAYCGFNDIGAFRRFYISGLVLPFYLMTLKCGGYNKRKVLSLLEDLPYEQYWSSDDDPAIVYPDKKEKKKKEEEKKNNYRAGLVTWQLLRSLRKGLPVALDPAVQVDFEQMTNCKLPKTPAPLTEEQVPSFGPFTGECELEALNRCLCLFSHIKFTTNKSQWGKRFFGQSAFDTSVMITEDYLPNWMRTTHAIDLEAPDEYAGPRPTNESKPVTVRWKSDSKNKKNAKYVAKLQEEDEYDSIPQEVVILVSRSMLGAEVRDRIREEFKLHEFEGQLSGLILHVEGAEKDFPALEADWDPILDHVFNPDASASFWCLFQTAKALGSTEVLQPSCDPCLTWRKEGRWSPSRNPLLSILRKFSSAYFR